MHVPQVSRASGTDAAASGCAEDTRFRCGAVLWCGLVCMGCCGVAVVHPGPGRADRRRHLPEVAPALSARQVAPQLATPNTHIPGKTMTSREIAELTGKEHKNVLADIRRVLEELGLAAADFSATAQVAGPNGSTRQIEVYNLPKRETLILVSGYSVVMRARIIDRWRSWSPQRMTLWWR